MRKHMMPNQQGFTLIELVTVIVILGVLAVGISNFLQFGTSVYAQSIARDSLVNGARFAIEPLNREVRHALPNSLHVTINPGGQCLTYTPIHAATIYQEVPVFPEPASNTVVLVPFDNSLIVSATNVIVYPTQVADVVAGSGKTFPFSALNTAVTPWVLTLNNSVRFAEDSPTQRIFFVGGQTNFCTTISGELTRNGVVIATDIITNMPFEVLPPTLQRNAMVKIELTFETNDEQASFNTEIQVPNVP